MKMQLRDKDYIRKATLLLTGMVFLAIASAFAQVDTAGQVHPSKPSPVQQPPPPPPTQFNPQTPAQAYPTTPQSMPMDTVKKNSPGSKITPPDPNTATPPKLTEAQIRILVGKDVPVGNDEHGRKLYKDSTRMIYYVSDGGTKVYVK